MYALMRTLVMDVYTALQYVLSWVIQWVRKNVFGVRDEYDEFISKVDEVQEVYLQADGNTTTLQRGVVSDRQQRLHLIHLLTTGVQLKRKLEKTNGPKILLATVKERLDKIRKLVSGTQAAFIGSEGKIKPLTVYFHGAPGVGKSIMMPHLCHDLCYVMKDEPFDKARDFYPITPKTAWHDAYAYQRFAVRNDVLQMKDEEMRTNEIFDLINMADETPFPLEIAHCEGKGQVYFTSPYLFLTSNFDIRRRTNELAARMVEPEALIRRLDLIIRVERDASSTHKPFDRASMRFNVEHRGKSCGAMDWFEMVSFMAEVATEQFGMSQGATTVSVDADDRARLDEIIRAREAKESESQELEYIDAEWRDFHVKKT